MDRPGGHRVKNPHDIFPVREVLPDEMHIRISKPGDENEIGRPRGIDCHGESRGEVHLILIREVPSPERGEKSAANAELQVEMASGEKVPEIYSSRSAPRGKIPIAAVDPRAADVLRRS